jgi:hypothetical protein
MHLHAPAPPAPRAAATRAPAHLPRSRTAAWGDAAPSLAIALALRQNRAEEAPSGGEPLPAPLRAHYEGRFGHGFGDVRVIRGGAAEASAATLGAAAYTAGSAIVFGGGQYAPETRAGRRLIAHELAHVVQQRAGRAEGDAPESPSLEGAAERAADGARPGGGAVRVAGRARTGVARHPRSLGVSLDPRGLSRADLEEEVREIRRWLAESRVSSAETALLQSVLPELEARLLSVNSGMAPWIDLVEPFNREFAPVLHAFAVDPAGEPVTHTPGGRVGQASGAGLSAVALRTLFTATQRDKLTGFISTRRIPERLFNGDDVGGTSAQQRLLLAAHILATGTYQPGSFEQRVHARMCWHWVQIVHHYAGATPATGPIAQGVMGSFDALGGAVLGGGRTQGVFQGGRVYAGELPPEETPAGVGPLHEGTSHAEAGAREQERREADPLARATIHRRAALPFSRFDEVRPGDWLWYYNANASGGGGHSVIFSRWTSEAATSAGGISYREAIAFSQSRPERGGREHTVRLGDRFSPGERIYPITHITRVTPDAAPATRPQDILPELPARRAAALSAENQRFLRQKERRLPGQVDAARLRGWLRAQNGTAIAALGDRVTEGQAALLEQTNGSDEIETLVRLHQRLRALGTHARILETNTTRTYDERLDARHAEAVARATGEREEADREVAQIDAELAPVRAAIDEREGRRVELDQDPEIRQLGSRSAELWRRIQRLRRGLDRDALVAERQEVRDRIAELRAQQLANRGELREIRGELAGLRRRTVGLERRRTRATARRTAASERQLPYGLVHPGSLRGQDTGRPSGRLADLVPQPDWASLVEPAVPAAP